MALDAPLSSVAVTVTSADPAATPVTVTVFPDTDTVATPGSSELALTVWLSPASLSVTVTATSCESSGAIARSAIAATAGREFTRIVITFAAEVALDAPLSSRTRTVSVVCPDDTPVIVAVAPETETVITDVSAEVARTV